MGLREAHTAPIELILVSFERAQKTTPETSWFPTGAKSASPEKAPERSYKRKKVTLPPKKVKKWKIQTRITFFIFNQSGWMTYRWIPCMKSFRMVYHLFGGFGTGPGRDWTTRLWPGRKFFWCHQIEHPKLPGKRFLLHLFIFSKHRITLVQSFFKYR